MADTNSADEYVAVVHKYQQRAANPSTRYVRASDVVADLRRLAPACACGWTKPLGPFCPDCGGRTATRPVDGSGS